MRISVAWVRALLPALEGSAHEEIDGAGIAERLTGGGLEVEAIERFGAGCEGVMVARVVSVRPHPKKSGLQLVTVDTGHAQQEVVCGAKNVPPSGGLVVLAPLGAELPAKGVTIAARDIAGVKSEGMLCSEEELGLAFAGKGEDGILVLPEGLAEPGTPLPIAIPSVVDEILEIGVTPNRPDALGHVGVARELAALLGLPFETPTPTPPEAQREIATGDVVKVSVDPAAQDRCPHYGALAVLDVAIGASPLWVRYRLHALGVRSISNAVDVTNLVMLEYGHPLHAFDLDRLEGSAIHVRLARAGEKVVTLDGVERTLTADDLVICDGASGGGKPVAIAGVMGAGNSEISSATKRILLECAWFDPRSVRRSARRHGLHTESSHRFERGVDRGGAERVIAQAGALAVHLAGGGVAKTPLHVVSQPVPEVRVTLRHARLESLIGMKVDREESIAILVRLGCKVSSQDGDASLVVVPTHRPDLGREVDLIEEVLRVRGFDSVPTELPAIRPSAPRATGVLERRVRHVARELGLSEAVCFAFGSPRELQILGAPEPVITLQNPLGEERGAMRTSLLPGLLAALRRSRHRGERRVRLFEVGARFLAGGPEADRGLCDEVPSFAAVIAGPREAWLGGGEDVDVWDAKGIATELVARVTHRKAEIELCAHLTDRKADVPLAGAEHPRKADVPLAGAEHPGEPPPHLHPRGAARVMVEGITVGSFGPLHPDMVERLDLDGPALVVEIDLRALEAVGTETPRHRRLPELPAATRDVALEAGEAVTAGDLQSRLKTGAGAICAKVEVFDVYRGKGIAPGKKSIAFRLTYRDPEDRRTLTDAEVDAANQQAIAATKALGAVQRV